MLTSASVTGLFQLPPPLLTLYLQTSPDRGAGPRSMAASLTWLKTEAKAAVSKVPEAERSLFLSQVERTEKVLNKCPPSEHSLLILAGADVWKQFPLGESVENEFHWGAPALATLIELLDEQPPICIVAVDHAGVRFFLHVQGEFTELVQRSFDIDVSQWKKKEQSHSARRGQRMPHGPQRDVFQQRVDAQYRRFCEEIGKQVTVFEASDHFLAVFLVGPTRLAEVIASHLATSFADRVVLIDEDIARMSTSDLRRRVEPDVVKWLDRRAMLRVEELLAAERGVVMGLDETLTQIQSGSVRTLLLARGFRAMLRRCKNCGAVSRSGDPTCLSCGGSWEEVELRDCLPQLAEVKDVKLEFVKADAAKRLIKSGGIGGWLRQSERIYEVPGTSTRL